IDFRSYTLEIGEGNDPESFELIFASDRASMNGILMPAFVTSDYREGTYTIRLSVLDVLGQESSDRKTIQVDNIRITDPLNNDLIAADSMIVVHGSVLGESLEYRLEYAKGFNPSVWESDAIVTAEPNGGNLENAPLGLWDLRRLESDQFYSLRLTAFRGDTEIDVDLVHMVYLDGRMRSGWPQYLPVQGDYPPEDWRFVKCRDLDQDGFQEIIIVDHGNEDGLPAVLVVFNHDGQVQWKTELGSGIPFTDVPLVFDLDGDGFFEIYVEAGSEEKLYAFDHQGQPLSGNWPLDLDIGDLGKSAADLNGDGVLELIGLSQDDFIKDGGRKRLLLVVNHNGEILAEWELPFCSVGEDVPEIMPVVGNLDADADLEIVAVSGCNKLVVLKLNQPGKIHRTIEIDGTLLSSPVVGDLDGDGQNEIIVSSFDEDDELQGGIYVFDARGELLPGWPVLVEESFSVSPALADFDQDGDLEICIPSWSSRVVHLLHHFGFEAEGWPVGPFPSTQVQSGPVIGDIDGDGAPDVVLATQGVLFHTIRTGDLNTIGGIQAWSFAGDSIDLNSHSKVTSLIMESTSSQPWLKSSPVTLTDLDGNGLLDVVATSIQDAQYGPGDPPAVRKNRSSIYVWEFDVPFSQSTFPWPAFLGGSGQNGFLEPVEIPNEPPVLGLIPDQVVSSGEAFFPLELDRFVEDANDGPLGLSWSISGNRELEVFIDRDFIAHIMVSDASWTGEESLKFVARDPDGLSSEAWVRFRVVSGVDLPVAGDDFVEVQEDASIQFN
ncbi:MAG TPA: VCBS repeat-containing protein, partial [Verrucomicrobia bacterium]|nr:VCBS repeat-containing protein [Verrucomicrobiota bacterium]